MRVLTVNVGSSSLKVDVVEDGVRSASYPDIPKPLPRVDAVGYRIVHGGSPFRTPTVVDDGVVQRLKDLTPFAPLHQLSALEVLSSMRDLLPQVPHVACFDTAFHATLPAEAFTYAIPLAWRRLGVRRYGFHGLSHARSSRTATALFPGARRVVTCHLGAGASLAAVMDGVAVDTTMGLTPLEGLVMATRSGSVDPGAVLWLVDSLGLPAREVQHGLLHSSGLLGLAGSGDLRDLLPRTDPDALLAVGVYLHHLVGGIAAMAASLQGLDVLVFTGGAGESSAPLRELTVSRLGYLGASLDSAANLSAGEVSEISHASSQVKMLVLRCREDLEIAELVEEALR